MGRVAFAKQVKRRLSNATIDAAQALKKAGKEMEGVALLLWEEKPEWQQDGNQFIVTGYRYGVSAIFSKISRLILETTCPWIRKEVLEELDVYPQRISQYVLSSDRISIALHITVWHLQRACTALCHCTYCRYSCLRNILFRRCHMLRSLDSVRHDSKLLP